MFTASATSRLQLTISADLLLRVTYPPLPYSQPGYYLPASIAFSPTGWLGQQNSPNVSGVAPCRSEWLTLPHRPLSRPSPSETPCGEVTGRV